MNRPHAWTRRAEEFDLALSGGPTTPEHDELLGLVASLRAVPEVTAREEFVSSLRTQLVAAAQREPARVEEELALKLTPRQRKGSRERRLAAVVGGFAVVSATGSMAVAAQSSLPGDVLYPVKRAMENASTNLKSDTGSRADSVLSHAEARLQEAEKLTARGADADLLADTLQDFVDQTKQASELALDSYTATGDDDGIADLRSFAKSSMDSLAALGPLVPDGARSMLITATQTVRQIDAAAWEACPSCADGAVTEVPDFAALPLADILNRTIPKTASVSQPLTDTDAPAKKDKSSSTKRSDKSTADEKSDPLGDIPDVIDKGDVTDPLSKTVDKVTDTVDKTVDKTKDGDSGSSDKGGSSSDKGLTGTLVDGLAGVLGGLLG